MAFYGLGAHLGRALSQNAQGHLLGHVRDQGLSSVDPNVRIYQTRERQTFHTDSADVVGLLCLQPARRGGASALVSSTTLYNEMRARRPELAACLFEPLATDRRGEVPPGAKPYFEIPVFNWFAGRLSAIYQRQYIDSAQRFADAPRLTARQLAALDLLDALANDPALHFTMESAARRHAVRAQPHPAARPHRVRRLARSRSGSATCCGCGWRPPARGRCRRCSRSATATSWPAIAAACRAPTGV